MAVQQAVLTTGIAAAEAGLGGHATCLHTPCKGPEQSVRSAATVGRSAPVSTLEEGDRVGGLQCMLKATSVSLGKEENGKGGSQGTSRCGHTAVVAGFAGAAQMAGPVRRIERQCGCFRD